MLNDLLKSLAVLALSSTLCPSVLAAGGTAQTVPVKMGYFNLLQVKAAYPEAAAANTLEERAKELLRRDVEQANSQLQEMQKQNKPKEEIEKKVRDLQTEISAKQQAMGQLLSSNTADANRAIALAVAAVAKDKGLDVVIDAAGIYAGGDKFATSGEDVTDAILKRLVPPGSSSKPAAEGAASK